MVGGSPPPPLVEPGHVVPDVDPPAVVVVGGGGHLGVADVLGAQLGGQGSCGVREVVAGAQHLEACQEEAQEVVEVREPIPLLQLLGRGHAQID